jgi:AcrR family transcriptional regulator
MEKSTTSVVVPFFEMTGKGLKNKVIAELGLWRMAMSTSKQDTRRQRLAEVVMNVISSDGIEAATVRRIAGAVGSSTTVITRYFSDKQDMLLCAYRTFGEINRQIFAETISDDPTDLVGYLISLSALDSGGLGRWRTYVSVWDKALHDVTFARELRSWSEQALGHIEILIHNRNPACRAVKASAKRFLAFIQGISVQLLFNPESWSTEELREALLEEIKLVLGAPAGSGAVS